MTTTDTRRNALLLRDHDGNYFVLPPETLERGRVPEERVAEVERLVAESEDGRPSEPDDVKGHLGPLFLVACAIWAVDAALIIGFTGPDVPTGPSTGGGSGSSGSSQPPKERIWTGRMQ